MASEKPVVEETVVHRIRITLTSRNVKSLEKGTLLLGSYFETELNIFHAERGNIITTFFRSAVFSQSVNHYLRKSKDIDQRWTNKGSLLIKYPVESNFCGPRVLSSDRKDHVPVEFFMPKLMNVNINCFKLST